MNNLSNRFSSNRFRRMSRDQKWFLLCQEWEVIMMLFLLLEVGSKTMNLIMTMDPICSKSKNDVLKRIRMAAYSIAHSVKRTIFPIQPYTHIWNSSTRTFETQVIIKCWAMRALEWSRVRSH